MSLRTRLLPHLRGHALFFDPPPAAPYEAFRGLRLLLVFVLLEGVLGPRAHLLDLLGVPAPAAWLRVPALLVLALALVRFAVGVRFAQIGLRRWREWTLAEKSYFVQVLVVANLAFALLFPHELGVTCLLWGLYQELVYRGILQTELVRRWGAIAGVLAANLLYTFGPLHAYHFSTSSPWMFAAVFAIGLFFGALFQRSRNLALVGAFHGVGDCYFAA